MSFGYSVADCIAALQLANKLRERFHNAPAQFKAIVTEVTNLSNVLREIEMVLSEQLLSEWQKKALASLLQECRNILIALGKIVDENHHMEISNIHSFRDKSRRVWKRLTWEPDDIQELRLRIALNIALLNAFNGSLMNKIASETRSEVQRLHERHDIRERKEEDQAILDWLTPINYTAEQHDFISRRQAGTGKWLLDSEAFQTWLGAGKQTLFCPGIPGAGKTIVASIVIEDLYARFGTDGSVGMAYLYCNFKRSHEQKLEGLLASLLKQLCELRVSVPTSVKALYNHHKVQRTQASLKEIQIELLSVVSSFSRVFFVIDALDECQTNDRCRSRLISELLDLQEKSGANIFATSRFIPEIIEQFKGSTSVEIRASDADLRRYLDSHMARLPRCVSRSADLQEDIKKTIIKAVDGMFLLALLHLDSLIDKTTPRAITRALANLPKGAGALYLAYEKAIQRIQGQEPGFVELAWRVLSWITCAKRPLTGLELQHALSIEIGDVELGEDNIQDIEEIVSLCAGLVTIDEEGNIIRLIHYTTQEYFEQMQSDFFPDAQRDIAVSCITYVSFDAFASGYCTTDEDFEARLKLYPFYKYAARFWGYHYRAAPEAEVEEYTLSFLENDQKVVAACQGMVASRSVGQSAYSQRVAREVKGAHLAAFYQLSTALEELSKRGYNLDSKDTHGQTPLSWAAENGHVEIVKLLLQKGAELDSTDSNNQTPLLWAVRNGHGGAVNLLLEKGANPESRDNFERTILLWAARRGHEEMVTLLLSHGAELNSRDTRNQTPLFEAARNGHESTVKLLLAKGAEVNSKDISGRSILSCAVENGHEAVVTMLLEKEAEIQSADVYGRTPLLWAARKGHERIARILLERGADKEVSDSRGRTPLMWAMSRKQEAVVSLLLGEGTETYGHRVIG